MKDYLKIKNCPAYEDYDVFGVDREGCCYKYHDFCKNIENCTIKSMLYKYGNAGIERVLGVTYEDEIESNKMCE